LAQGARAIGARRKVTFCRQHGGGQEKLTRQKCSATAVALHFGRQHGGIRKTNITKMQRHCSGTAFWTATRRNKKNEHYKNTAPLQWHCILGRQHSGIRKTNITKMQRHCSGTAFWGGNTTE
jgi:hypothetical protein